ncbi:MAG TPA: contractile injection system tape measure protein [Bacteroidales bacterium]|nr:contractile injection system tape measure protein [Bacteroidales bacterium]
MLIDAVNKLIIEFTCNSEDTAKEVSRGISNYWTNRFSEILSRIISAKIDSRMVLKIDRLEVELGDISPGDFVSQEVYSKLETLLTETVEKVISKTSEAIEGAGKTSIQILKTLLLTGDLPWWMDKNSTLKLDDLLKTSLEENKEDLKQFLLTHKDNPDVMYRVQKSFSPGTVKNLKHVFPKLHPKSNLLYLSPRKLHWDKLHGSILQKISDALNKSYRYSGFKHMLVQNIIENHGHNLIQGVIRLHVFSEKQLSMLESELISGKTHVKTESHLLQLNWYQLEFLSRPELWKEQTGVQNRRAMEKIKIHGFRQVFEKRSAEMIIIHPGFLANNVLGLLLRDSPLSGSTPFEISDNQLDLLAFLQRIHKTHHNLLDIVKRLSRRQTSHLTKVIDMQRFPSVASKKSVEQILKKLPQKDLQLISQLTQLGKSEIEIIRQTVQDDIIEKAIIENAGLCIVAPFLTSLFNRLGFIQNGKFTSKYAAHRAVYILEYMVNGRQKNYEYKLLLNKLLCGMDLHEPITGFKRLTAVEKQETNDLLSSVIDHWKALKTTSVKGLQTSFIQRKGILTEKNDNWTLQVEKTAFDLLLDSMPWNYHYIKFSWMKKKIQVEW